MKLRIGVIGQSGNGPLPMAPGLLEKAEAVGREIAARGAALLCGGRCGVMEAACKGAKSAGGITVGVLPGEDTEDCNPYVDIAITTGVGLDTRSAILVKSCDALIMLGGGNGTLTELSLAYTNGRPVVILRGTGGWSDRIQAVCYDGHYLDERRIVPHFYADTPAEAVEKALMLARARCAKSEVAG
ncbi:MAG: TIGR00725 family protein [Firmicutes bacterium]|nr:TIGR00725 family protein [Bacillota bacterium]